MKKEFFLTFWRAILIIIFMTIITGIFSFVLVILPTKYMHISFSGFYFRNVQSFVYIITDFTIIVILTYRYKINFRLQINKVSSRLTLLFFVITIVIFANIIPLVNPIDFVEKLFNSRILFHKFEPNIISYIGWFGFIESVIFIPILEELLFRGIFLNQFLKRYSVPQSLIYSSIIFAAFHLRPLAFGYLFLYGLLFGYAYYKTNSLTTSIFLHILINFMAKITTIQHIEIGAVSLPKYILFLGASIFIILMVFSVINKGANSVKLDTSILKEKIKHFYSQFDERD
jgi:membrane protease YdiL (CAAX protease family)